LKIALLLALQLGRTLEELGNSMSADEFGLWLALYQTDPWDQMRSDLRAGIIAATIANHAGLTRKAGVPPSMPSDFMPYLKKHEEPEAEADPVAYFKQFS
jgi:hypothetical protein